VTGTHIKAMPSPAKPALAVERPGDPDDHRYRNNLDLGQAELALGHSYLRAMPRYLTVVIGNRCNIYCPHCYQLKNGDHLFGEATIGHDLRRELMGFYPYLSTLRLMGGEVFALEGFAELVEDVATIVSRPIVSVSTNGTLIDDTWADRIVSTPFQSVTVSIDGGTPETYARLRRGADLDSVLSNLAKIQKRKRILGAPLPFLDSFFVIMRSTFREIPQYFELMRDAGIDRVSMQTVLVDERNLAREPSLGEEVIREPADVFELHSMLLDLLPRELEHFAAINTSGLTSLFRDHGLSGAFLREDEFSLYPDIQKHDPEVLPRPAEKTDSVPTERPETLASARVCPNPWTTIFVAENGDVSLCHVAEPLGNLYEESLARMWNCGTALAMRSEIQSGRYASAGCSPQYCSWREGEHGRHPVGKELATLREDFNEISALCGNNEHPDKAEQEPSSRIAAVRRMMTRRRQRIAELEAKLVSLSSANAATLESAQRYIDHLEHEIDRVCNDYGEFRCRPLVRWAARAHQTWGKLKGFNRGRETS
jgi:MoaA/NifB/PqqE/SkfB family radical SAM enzyme